MIVDGFHRSQINIVALVLFYEDCVDDGVALCADVIYNSLNASCAISVSEWYYVGDFWNTRVFCGANSGGCSIFKYLSGVSQVFGFIGDDGGV